MEIFLERLKNLGTYRKKLDDRLFAADESPARLGIYDLDEENLCHDVVKTACHIPSCTFTAESILEFENHYNTSHRYSCSECKKVLPSPHFLDLHIQESHDSFFAVMSERKPSYCCYIEECKEKFKHADERLNHCVKVHKLPKDFRFDQKPKNKYKGKNKSVNTELMEVDKSVKEKKVVLNNSKQKTFTKYKGIKFTTDNNEKLTPPTVNVDKMMTELKESLPN